MADDWMTDEHKAAALEGFQGNPVAVAYARQIAEDERWARLAAAMVAWVQEQVADDRSIAEAALADDYLSIEDESDAMEKFRLRFGAESVLARCAAYTAIVDRYVVAMGIRPNRISSFVRGQDDGYQQGCFDAIRDIAVSMAERPGFREEWRPSGS